MQVLDYSSNQVSAESNNINVSPLETIQNSKLFDCHFDEEIQPAALKKNSSKIKKHHKYTQLLAI